MFRPSFRRLLACSASCFILGAAGTGHAQTPPDTSDLGRRTPAGAGASGGRTEDIIVTAQKRSVKLEKLATTITVLGGKSLQTYEVRSLSQLNKLVPGFYFESSQGGNQVISIRGVGTTSAGQSLEQSVSAYIDGVYMGGNLREFATPLYDISQVEVLKGTQSGISGQNTSVGALNIVTTAPGSTFGGYVTAGHEFNYDGYNAEGAVNLPIASNFHVRLAGFYNDIGGYIHDVVTKDYTGGSKTYSGRINTVWDVRNDVTVKTYLEYDGGNSLANLLVPFGSPPSQFYSLFIPNLQPDNIISTNFGHQGNNGNDFYNFDEIRGSVEVDVNLGGPILTSVTGGSHIRDQLGVDGDNSALDLSWLGQNSKYSQIHQELRLVSPNTDRLKYIVGVWYRHSIQDKAIDFSLDPAPFVSFLANIPFKQITDTESVFGDLHYDVTPKFTIGGTARYTYETKTGQIAVNSNWPVTFLPYPETRGTLTPSFVDGSATAQYSPTATSMVYVLYAHGTKTGAFVDLSDALVPLKPEETDTFEVGTKLRFPEANLTTNLSAFRMNVTNYQDVYVVSGNGVTAFQAQNRNLHTEGIEYQTSWRPLPDLTLGVAGTFLDSHDQTGGQAARAPHVTVSANARYDVPLPSDRRISVFGNVFHTSDYLNNVTLPNPDFTRTPPYTFVDLGVEVAPLPSLTVKFLVQNVTNQHAYLVVNTSSVDPSATIGALLPLRRMTLTGTYNF